MNTALPSITTLRKCITLRERIARLERKLTSTLNGSIVGARVASEPHEPREPKRRHLSPAQKLAQSKLMKARWRKAHAAGNTHL